MQTTDFFTHYKPTGSYLVSNTPQQQSVMVTRIKTPKPKEDQYIKIPITAHHHSETTEGVR